MDWRAGRFEFRVANIKKYMEEHANKSGEFRIVPQDESGEWSLKDVMAKTEGGGTGRGGASSSSSTSMKRLRSPAKPKLILVGQPCYKEYGQILQHLFATGTRFALYCPLEQLSQARMQNVGVPEGSGCLFWRGIFA